jgi:ATP-dependent Lhr-like helicase
VAYVALESFHPAVATWFRRRFPLGPTEAQALGWRSIASGEDTLIAAPTGSGKTLAAFLVAIDRCLAAAMAAPTERPGTSVVYVSPLRALTVDIAANLVAPLAEIAEIAVELGYPRPDVRVAVRNGDTPQSERVAMLRDRPEIVVTTPESLYLLLTARRGRELLGAIETVIVDEVHALAKDKRGAHLALSLERLDHLVQRQGGRRPVRIGCSATQRPIEEVARLLVGVGPDRVTASGAVRCEIVDVGHSRPLDIAIELPSGELGAVMPTEQLDEIVGMMAAQVAAHRSTLIFVNTRRMSERIGHLLGELIGQDAVAAHHGSLSVARRLNVESRLRAGELRAVVATASLELGIDVGPVDLVCQLGSPRAIATFLQRVGRAEHRRDGLPKGRVFPTSRDELVECVALFGAVADGCLDLVHPPVAPLDILAQQIVAECAARGDDGIPEVELAALVRGATPYAALDDVRYAQVLSLVSDGVETGRGRRGAYVHRDEVNGVLRARRGARLTASTSGGAIPELADYRVVLEPEQTTVGSVHEDFAVEAMAGDVFLLGSTSWRVLRVEQGVVRVVDAKGAAPTLPFWLGEAPGRTTELADAVSLLRARTEAALRAGGPSDAVRSLMEWSGVSERAAEEVVAYLGAALTELGALPTKSLLIFERFFDDAGGMQFVVHAPYGARVNRGLGLALRKRFCRNFDFELQAAANDDAIVLSLGAQHSFALEEVSRFLSPATVREVVVQAVLPTPIFTSRWRWNLGRSLVAPRFRGARHLPPAIQRMEADDLMAAIFPQLAACQENVAGPIQIPDHPIVAQTLDDCCTEAMDLEALIALVGGIRSGEVGVRCVDTVEPSVLTHEILNGRPYTFLDDAPLEERRTRAVAIRRGIPLEAHDLSELDPLIIAEVESEVTPSPRDAEEFHDLLLALGILRAEPRFSGFADLLATSNRVLQVMLEGGDIAWCATERRELVEAAFPTAKFSAPWRLVPAPAHLERLDAMRSVVAGHLDVAVPLTLDELAQRTCITDRVALEGVLAQLEARGQMLRVQGDRFGAKRIVARIHSRQRDRTRRSIEPVPIAAYLRFLVDYQHLGSSRLSGIGGLLAVIDQLQGLEAPAGAWEESILPARVAGYTTSMLDQLAANGEVGWARLTLRGDTDDEHRSGSTPSRATPIALFRRSDADWLLAAARGEGRAVWPNLGAAAQVCAELASSGALFFSDLVERTHRLPVELAEALWDGVARGVVTSDGFTAMRVLLSGRYRASASRGASSRGVRSARPGRPALRRLSGVPQPGAHKIMPALAGGRWSLVAEPDAGTFERDELAESVATQLLERWGVVCWEIAQRERLGISWREVLWALRRLEARGLVRGGRFIAGPVGEQFALENVGVALQRAARADVVGHELRLSAADPLNLTGILLPGPRVPAVRGRELLFVDGVPRADQVGSAAS